MKVAFQVVVFYVVTVSLLSSCNKSVVKLAVDEKLLGSWEWIRTDGGIANNVHETPASTGKEKTLVLNANNTYVITVNGAIFSQGSFTVISKQCIHDGTNKAYIQFDHDPGMMVEEVDATILKLSDEANDGTDAQYHRTGTTQPG
jgi:hypothetical protein